MKSENEPTLYVKKEGKSDFIIICLYVDDIIYTVSSNSLVDKFKSQMLSEFEICKPAATPMNINEKLQHEDEAEMVDARRFRSLPSKVHYRAAKRVLCYVARTIEYGIWYFKSSNFKLYGFTDGDWAGLLDDRRSISANVFTLGSGVITWSSKKQATVALSTSEAEYVAAALAACQAI
ncbi:secreted RxLR effector protein 161-like [Jatropha curcas]|uniref:secreted RxLR effector protein 161-like n=1 Tax=Jatropha curcas TaxID=180498 RepID=UPI0009D7719C|nr:secreted RxLR effector protein 161-like [Jatropha curcas]